MKTYNVIIGGKNIEVIQNEDGTFTKPQILEELNKFGTALKPAFEPICMAMKPLAEKNFATNVLKYGTGGINIDESRVGLDGETPPTGSAKRVYAKNKYTEDKVYGENKETSPLGRFPANLIHDDSEEVRECFPETKSGGISKNYKQESRFDVGEKGKGGNLDESNCFGDSGNASRFFKSIIYQAKASKSERNKGCEDLDTTEKFTAGNYSQSPTCKDCEKTLNGTNDHSKCSGEVYYKEMESKNTKNNHPTVKPVALMEYLIKMVTPQCGTVLDPFMGSGSTGVAAIQNGFNFIGIEKEEEYIKIANARLGIK